MENKVKICFFCHHYKIIKIYIRFPKAGIYDMIINREEVNVCRK